MGETAEIIDDDEIEFDGGIAEDDAIEKAPEEDVPLEDEVEIVTDDDEVTQPLAADAQALLDRVVTREKAKLKAKIDTANGEKDETARQLALAQEKLELYELERAQQSGPPDPDSFDGGASDPAYIKQQTEHNLRLVQDEVDRKTEEARAKAEDEARKLAEAEALKQKQIAHYERASKLKVKDYAGVEDQAIEALGEDLVNGIIGNFEESETLLFYLGNNPAKAQKLANAIATNPVVGTAEIGRLLERIKVRPKTTPPPDPDEEITGAVSAAKSGALAGVKFE